MMNQRAKGLCELSDGSLMCSQSLVTLFQTLLYYRSWRRMTKAYEITCHVKLDATEMQRQSELNFISLELGKENRASQVIWLEVSRINR